MGTAFSGASSFNKLGAGTLTLSGNNAAFTGNTAIRAGTLQVDGILGGPVNVLAGARLTGTGRVGATTNQGVIAPGPRSGFGTLTIAGDYAGQGGGLEVRTRQRRQLADRQAGDHRRDRRRDAGHGEEHRRRGRGDPAGHTDRAGQWPLGGPVQPGQRRLRHRWASGLVAGACSYVLQQDPADGGWYLRSS